MSGWIVAIVVNPDRSTINTFLIEMDGVCHTAYNGLNLAEYTQRMAVLMDRVTDGWMYDRLWKALRNVYVNASVDVDLISADHLVCEPSCLRSLRMVLRSGPTKSMRNWVLPRVRYSGGGTTPKQQNNSRKGPDCGSKSNYQLQSYSLNSA